MKILGDRLLGERLEYGQHGRLHLTEKTKFDFLLSRPQVYRVVGKGTGRTARARAVLEEIALGDRVICFSHTEGVTEAPGGLFVIPLSVVIAVLPHP